MNKKEHLWVCVAFAIGLLIIIWKLTPEKLLLYSLPAPAFTILPDGLEPPINPFHRAYFHSKRFFRVVVVLLIIFLILAIINSEIYFFGVFACVGYILHLIADSISFRGLPN
jgi:membrane-bound metal-dependent hydrolase YbcI (DUF457 family)